MAAPSPAPRAGDIAVMGGRGSGAWKEHADGPPAPGGPRRPLHRRPSTRRPPNEGMQVHKAPPIHQGRRERRHFGWRPVVRAVAVACTVARRRRRVDRRQRPRAPQAAVSAATVCVRRPRVTEVQQHAQVVRPATAVDPPTSDARWSAARAAAPSAVPPRVRRALLPGATSSSNVISVCSSCRSSPACSSSSHTPAVAAAAPSPPASLPRSSPVDPRSVAAPRPT